MGMNMNVQCPLCEHEAGVRFDPGPEDAFPSLARMELAAEHPDHTTARWKFPSEFYAAERASREKED